MSIRDLDVKGPRQVNGANGPLASRSPSLSNAVRQERAATLRQPPTVSYGQQRLLAGRLTTPEGARIVGARVCLAAAMRGG